MGQKVYVSYSRTDKEKVYEIKEWLESQTAASFIMCQNDVEGLPEQYVMDAVKGINDSDIFLFMLSESSQYSERPLMELAYVCKKQPSEQKRIYIINIDSCVIKDAFLFRWGNYRLFDWSSDTSKAQLTVLLKPVTEKTDSSLPKLHTINRNGRYGFVNHEGEIVIPCRWTKVDDFYEGLAAVDDSSGKWGYLDVNGNRIIPCKWAKVGSFEDGFAVVENKYGAYDYKGGVIDSNGNLVIPINYGSLEYIGCGLFKYYVSPRYGIINGENESVISPTWQSIGKFSEGLCPVANKDSQMGYIDRNGQLSIPCWWNRADNFSEGLAVVGDKDFKYGVIDINGNVVIPCYHDGLSGFSEGLCAFKKDGKTGFINKADEIVIEAAWDTKYGILYDFHSGRMLVKNAEDKYGYINKLGSLVIPYTWTDAESFENGTAWVKVDDTWKLIDTDGNYV